MNENEKEIENEKATFRVDTDLGPRIITGIKKFNRRKKRFVKNPKFEWCEKNFPNHTEDYLNAKAEKRGKIKFGKVKSRKFIEKVKP